jgi:hypothetical protein
MMGFVILRPRVTRRVGVFSLFYVFVLFLLKYGNRINFVHYDAYRNEFIDVLRQDQNLNRLLRFSILNL